MFSTTQTSYNQGVIMKKGSKQSPEAKQRMSIAKKGTVMSEEQKKKISAALKGRPKSPEHVAKVAKSNTGKKRSDEFRQFRSEFMKQAWLDNPNMTVPMSNNAWAIPTIYNGIQMRSKLEARYAKSLDEQNIQWEYESKRFDLGETSYTPDFYLIESDTYIEVKGWNQNLDKVEVFKKMGYNIIVVREGDI